MLTDNYTNYWKNKRNQQKQKLAEEMQKARQTLEEIKNILIKEFKVTKIILFGSLVKGNFHQESDIDLAVSGINKNDYFRAFARVNNISNRPVDLKPLEDLEPYFLQKILKYGECIYEQNNLG